MHAQLAAHVEDLVEGVDGRGDLQVAGLADLLPVAGQLLHGGVDLFEEDQHPGAEGLRVGVDAEFVGDPGSQPPSADTLATRDHRRDQAGRGAMRTAR
ncbi:hypothetical protein ACIA8I_41300 [Streptomyces rishiriensis]|uniref:hypothetical protein n=1 Tax=Streptomyces rishiriensis TaxID=68264 RepID=UPI0037B4FE4C